MRRLLGPMLALLAVLPASAGAADNGRIAVQADVSGLRNDIVTLDPASGARRVLTSELAGSISPEWTSDGSHILFTRVGAEGGPKPAVFAMASDGSAKVPLADDATDPSISRDGRVIAFLRYDNIEAYRSSTSISVANPNGTGQRRVTPLGQTLLGPELSPDGRRIVFAAPGPGARAGSTRCSTSGRSTSTGLG